MTSSAPRGSGLTISIISLGVFVVNLDITLVNAIFPALLADVGPGIDVSSWAVNAQSLGLAAGFVAGGRLGDTLGRRDVFATGLLGYGVFALACGIIPSVYALIAIRFLMGLAGALVLPTSLALVADSFASQQRPRALAIWAGIAGIAGIVGPVLGVMAVRWLSWEWAFVLLSPICLASAIAARSLLAASPRQEQAADVRTGVVGGALVAATVGTWLIALAVGPRAGWTSAGALVAFAAAALGAVAVLVLEWRSTHPQFPHDLRNRPFATALAGITTIGFAFGVGLFSIPLVATQLQGGELAVAGVALLPAATSGFVFAFASGHLVERYGTTRIAGLGLTFAVTAVFAFATLGVDSSRAALLAISAFSGIGIGLGLPAFAGGALEAAGERRAGLGGGWYNTFRQLGIASGIACFAILLAGDDTDPSRFPRAFVTCGLVTVVGLGVWGGLARGFRSSP